MADEWADFNPTAAPTGGGDEWADFNPTRAPEDVTAGMALRGIPVLGAYIPQAEAAIRAAIGRGSDKPSWRERYEEILPQRQADYATAEREQPIASTALQIGGGAAALAPLGATALGARALGGTGPIAQRIVAGGTSGAGISAADALARGEDPTTAAGIGGGLGAALPVVGAAVGRIGKTARGYLGAPSADELGQAVDAGYTALRSSGVEFNPTSVNRTIRQIKAGQTIHDDLSPKTLKLLNEAEGATTPRQPGAMAAVTGTQPTARAPLSFDDLDTLRKRLGTVARDFTNPTEQAAARDAQRGIDDFLANVTAGDVLKGNAAGLSAAAKATRANAAAEFRMRAIDAIRQRAEDQAGAAASGMNIENAYRQQLRAFIRPNNKGVSPATKEGFTPAEINRMRVATRGTSFPNMLRLVSNVLGGGHGIAAGAGLATAYATGDPRYLAAVGAGYAGRQMSNRMMRNRAQELSRMTAARSPLAQQMGVGGPGGPLLDLAPAQAGLLSMAVQQGTPRLLPPPQ